MLKHFKAMDLTAEGKVAAVVATMEVVDKDGDVTLPGFFGSQPTRMVWHHRWDQWIGKGRVYEQGKEAIFEGQFFMDTQAGAEAYKAVANMGDLAEWSYGFDIRAGGSRTAQVDGRTLRYLQPLPDGSPGVQVHEVSPVLVGAGEGTRTLAMKGMPLREQVSLVLGEVDELVQSVAALDAHLREGGHALSDAKAAVLAELEVGLQQALAAVSPVLHTKEADDTDPAAAAQAAHAHLQLLLAGLPQEA